MKLKSDPKYALKSFLALKMRECCNVVEDDDSSSSLTKTSFQTGPDYSPRPREPGYSQLAVQPNEERLGIRSICATNVVIRY